MGFKSTIRNVLDHALQTRGYRIVPTASLYSWQTSTIEGPSANSSALPPNATEYLRQHNPRLKALQERYLKFDDRVVAPSIWVDGYVRSEDITHFRGDNAYVWQLRGRNMNEMGYALTAYYLKSIDDLGLMEKLEEDTSFGNFSFTIDGKVISRDLLDSIAEICFLEKHLHISTLDCMTVLDIGAGYGRLAHRMSSAYPMLKYFCTDAVAASTFLSEFYLRYRGCEPRATVVPLDEVQALTAREKIDRAINIHCFSECTIAAIEWWIGLLRKGRVRFLMIVPNTVNGTGDMLLTNRREPFMPTIERNGYELIAKEPKYRDPVVQNFGINPTYHYLFELKRPEQR